MKQRNRHRIPFFIAAILLSAALLTPSIVKLAHVFQDHKHVICIDYQKTHLHEFDLDCEFYKFKINQQFSADINQINIIEVELVGKLNSHHYQFVTEFQYLQFLLRAPPSIV